MKRILVIGCCGSGKSTLSAQLNKITGLPIVHLDREFWSEGWKEPDKTEFRDKIDTITQNDRWIIDGHYYSTMDSRLARADTVFHLDFSTRICLGRVIKRTFFAFGKDRPDCADGCPERVNLGFLKYVIRFRSSFRDRTLLLLEKHSHLKTHSFKSPTELAGYLASMRVTETKEADG